MRRVIIAAALAGSMGVSLAAAEDVIFKDDIKQHIAKGEDTDTVKVVITVATDAIRVSRHAKDETVIPYAAISGITYDRRRRGSGWHWQGKPPKQQHMLTIQYKVGETGDYVELEMAKGVAPRLVAILEARSGKHIEKIVG